MRTLFSGFLKFYNKEYEEIKNIPISRLFGYLEYMNEYIKESNKDQRQVKIDKLKDTMTDEEKLKYEEEYGKRTT